MTTELVPKKRCAECCESKPLHQFGVNDTGALGRTGKCRACMAAQSKARRDRLKAEKAGV